MLRSRASSPVSISDTSCPLISACPVHGAALTRSRATGWHHLPADRVYPARRAQRRAAGSRRRRSTVKVGIPREVKNHEYRVAITPAGVHELVRNGHEVYVEKEAGVGSSILDDDYAAGGATILGAADDVWATSDMILKVKEPIAQEYERMREGQTLFTYLHLAAEKPLTEELAKRKVTGIAYETVQLPDRSLPLLAPMSEVARRLAPQVGTSPLMRQGGGRPPPAGGVVPPHGSGRRPRHPQGRRARRVRREGRRDRRRRVRAERRRDRARHAGRGAAARQERRAIAPDGRDLPGPLPDRRVQRLRGR